MATYTRKNEEPVQKGSYLEGTAEDGVSPIVEPVSADNIDKYAADLAFMAEPVEVLILPSYDPEDTTKLVSVSVNGQSYYFMRGQWRTCPRFVLEILATAKKQAWSFGYKKLATGQTTQYQDSSHLLRYPHQFRDKNPKGMAWYDSIKDRVR